MRGPACWPTSASTWCVRPRSGTSTPARSGTAHPAGASGSTQPLPFVDRADAGRQLAESLTFLRSEDVVVLGLARGGVPLALAGRVAVVVDDEIATGSTARAGCCVAGARGSSRVVLATPVASTDAVADLASKVEVVCLDAPRRLRAIGQWYGDFSQISDDEVVEALATSEPAREQQLPSARRPGAARPLGPSSRGAAGPTSPPGG